MTRVLERETRKKILMEYEMDQITVDEQREPKRILMEAASPITLKFEDVVHKIKIQHKGDNFFWKKQKTQERFVLKGTSGIVFPGEILAILGPSGSGKTTLLSALSGKLNNLTRGTITFNNKPFSKPLRHITSFVAQHNVFYPHLSVFETLIFTALLRLPNNLSKQEKISRVEGVIDQLQLNQVMNSRVGGRFVKGISGGERKRVCIGQELLMNPSLLLLDEPTTDLDSTVAKRIMKILRELAKNGRTLLMSIHQPSSQVFYMFDKVLLLSEGHSLYYGKRENVMGYFSSIGYSPLMTMNPSDFLLDLANGVYSGDAREDQKAVKQALISAYEHNLSENVKRELTEIGQDHSHYMSEEKEWGISWNSIWWQQFTVLLKRGLKERKHESFSPLKVCYILAAAFLAGSLWWKSDSYHIHDKVGLLFFYSKFWGFYPVVQAVFTFSKDKVMLRRERSSGMYKLSSYFMARTVIDLPMELILPTLFVTITYWMGGLKPTPINFFKTWSIVLLQVFVSQSLGLAIGAIFMNQKLAAVIGSVTMLLFNLFAGFYVQNMHASVFWIKYLSIIHYSYKLLLGSQFTADDTYPCASKVTTHCLVREVPLVKNIGLDGQGLCVFALSVMFFTYRFAAYFALMKVGLAYN